MSKNKTPATDDPLGAAWEGAEGNLGAPVEVVATVVKEPKARAKAAAPVAVRTRIILEESDEIPPSGQFFGADGVGYMLRPGEEADVPDSIISILDTAVKSVPIKDGSDTVIGYRDRLRFPYRIITQRRAA